MSLSQPESDKDKAETQCYQKIGILLVNGLRAAEKLLDTQTTNMLMERLNTISNEEKALSQIEYFIFVLLNNIEILKQAASMNIDKDDYHTLEVAVQKSEAEIRTHVRIEQQLKIYAQGIQQRLEELERELELQTEKYHKLYETAKLIDLEKKQLKRKIKLYEIRIKSIEEKSLGISHQKNSKIVSESSIHGSQTSIEKIYLDKGRTKMKPFLNQSSQKKYKRQGGFEYNPNKNRRLNSEIDVNAIHLQSKKEESITEPKQRQTIRLKQIEKKSQSRSGNYLKNSTQETGKRRETRSNSVCS